MTLTDEVAQLFQQVIVRASGQQQPELAIEFAAVADACIQRHNAKLVEFTHDKTIGAIVAFGEFDERGMVRIDTTPEQILKQFLERKHD